MLFSVPKRKCKTEQVEVEQQWSQALVLSLKSMSVH